MPQKSFQTVARTRGGNTGRAVTRTARASRGRMGHPWWTVRPATYRIDARRAREAAEARQDAAESEAQR
jgi:hypothetical protein